MKNNIICLDCTLRDGGYYNNWDFTPELISDYLMAMAALHVDYVEIGFRSLKNVGFKGGCAFSTDGYLNSLDIPEELKDKIGVMVNGSELIPNSLVGVGDQTIHDVQLNTLEKLFKPKKVSPVTLVRIACHVHELAYCLPAANWLKQQGYRVGFNIMQIAECTEHEIIQLAQLANKYPIDVLYFADSMGSLSPQQVSTIIKAFKQGWKGELGIHTHDNMGQAIANSVQAVSDGVTWVDSTVTGMGRGPGNAQTEYLSIALESNRGEVGNNTKLFELVRKHFKPLQVHYGWGINPYYYLAGKYGIHPSYIQEMLADTRYSEEDMLAVIEHLKEEGNKKFSLDTLEAARHYYGDRSGGDWSPVEVINNRDVLILGTGPGVANYRSEIEAYIEKNQPFVIALNTQKNLNENLINIRAACHPVRLLADCHEHLKLPQPLVTPFSMLPKDLRSALRNKKTYDFGICVQSKLFEFFSTHCTLPYSLVAAYALAIATSGKAKRILLVGFDGYHNGDPRNQEMIELFKMYISAVGALPIESLTPCQYQLPIASIYGKGE